MRALEELYDEGKVKAIGVYNFTQDRLADYLFFNKIKPVVNIIECNEINLDIFDLKLTEDEIIIFFPLLFPLSEFVILCGTI